MNIATVFESSNNQLGSIVVKAKLLNSLQNILSKYMDSEFARDFQVANYRQGCLVIQFTNAALATRFRYQIPDLLQRLRVEKQLPGIASIKCIVRPETMDVKPPTNKKQLSKKTSELLKQTAHFINIKDPSLAAALQKLSS